MAKALLTLTVEVDENDMDNIQDALGDLAFTALDTVGDIPANIVLTISGGIYETYKADLG